MWRFGASLWFISLGRTAPYADPCEHPHRTVETSRDDVLVDRLIAPLVEALWSSGIETYSSCQGEARLRRIAAAVMPNLLGDAYSASLTISTHDLALVIEAFRRVQYRHGVEPAEARIPSVAPEYTYLSFDPKLLNVPGHEEEIVAAIGDVRAGQKKALAASKRAAKKRG